MSLHVFSPAVFSAAKDLRCRVRADGDARAAGQAQDRTTISYTINEDDRAKAFDVMFALGARGSAGLACECLAALAAAPVWHASAWQRSRQHRSGMRVLRSACARMPRRAATGRAGTATSRARMRCAVLQLRRARRHNRLCLRRHHPAGGAGDRGRRRQEDHVRPPPPGRERRAPLQPRRQAAMALSMEMLSDEPRNCKAHQAKLPHASQLQGGEVGRARDCACPDGQRPELPGVRGAGTRA